MTDERQYRDDDRAVQLALFRYGVIAPIAERESSVPGEVSATVREIAGREHYLPGKGSIRISKRTIYAWLAAYRGGGIEALRPRRRKDRGRSRVLDDPLLERAITLRKELSKRTEWRHAL